MPKPTTLNMTLAINLDRLIKARGITPNALAKAAGLAGNTVGNYLKPAQAREHQYVKKDGKEPTASLANVEAIAAALKIPPLLLLMGDEDRASLAVAALRLSAQLVDADVSQDAVKSVTGESLLSLPSAQPTPSPNPSQKRRAAKSLASPAVARKP